MKQRIESTRVDRLLLKASQSIAVGAAELWAERHANASHNAKRLQFYRSAHKGLPRSVNRHGRCEERLIPMRLSATTSKVARELETKQ